MPWRMAFWMVAGVMLLSLLKVSWIPRRRLVSSMARFMLGVMAVGVEEDLGVHVAGAAADHLDQGGFAAEEALLVGVEDGDQRDFGQVESFAEEVDADEDVEGAFAEFAEDFRRGRRFGFRSAGICTSGRIRPCSGRDLRRGVW